MLQTKPVTRPVVGFDFDDVLIDLNSTFALYHNSTYGTSYTREAIQQYDLSSLLGCTYEEMMSRIHTFIRSPHHNHILPIGGAKELVAQMKDIGLTLHVVTARDKQFEDQAIWLLQKHFPFTFSQIHFLNNTGKNVLGTKGEVCVRHGISHLIEDSTANAVDAMNHGVTAILLTTPWNKNDILPKGVTRIHHLSECLEIICGE